MLTNARIEDRGKKFGVSNLLTKGGLCRSISQVSFPVIPVWLGIQQSSTCLPDFSCRECSPTICMTKMIINIKVFDCVQNKESEKKH